MLKKFSPKFNSPKCDPEAFFLPGWTPPLWLEDGAGGGWADNGPDNGADNGADNGGDFWGPFFHFSMVFN